jgi:hypothetical protein
MGEPVFQRTICKHRKKKKRGFFFQHHPISHLRANMKLPPRNGGKKNSLYSLHKHQIADKVLDWKLRIWVVIATWSC